MIGWPRATDKPRSQGENIGFRHKEVTGDLDKSKLGGSMGTRALCGRFERDGEERNQRQCQHSSRVSS